MTRSFLQISSSQNRARVTHDENKRWHSLQRLSTCKPGCMYKYKAVYRKELAHMIITLRNPTIYTWQVVENAEYC
jgi:dTDP-4-dehydrorhamnose 3,5-epimerase-like enzyme